MHVGDLCMGWCLPKCGREKPSLLQRRLLPLLQSGPTATAAMLCGDGSKAQLDTLQPNQISSLWACTHVGQRAVGGPPCSGGGSWDAGQVLCPSSSPLRASSLLLTVLLTALQPSVHLCPDRTAKGPAVPTWVNFKEKTALWIHTDPAPPWLPQAPRAGLK